MSEINIDKELITAALSDWKKLQQRDQYFRFIKFGCIVLLSICSIIFAMIRQPGPLFKSSEPYATLVSISGLIAPETPASPQRLSEALKTAFRDEDSAGVVLRINSGGGTPAAAMTIYRDILRLKEKYNKTVVVVAEDMMASGAYLVAMAADEIYAMPSSAVGSIGVIMESLAYSGFASEWGIENRVYTAGESKRRFDPFKPEKEDDVIKAQEILSEIHSQFIQIVEDGRGSKLASNKELLFSGDYWTGSRALEYGLIDHIGTLNEALEAEFKVSTFKEFKVASSIDDVLNRLSH